MLNLIADPWIPVRRRNGDTTCQDIIRPDQIAEPDVLFPDWPRADLNLACLELLIGLVYIAAPPVDPSDWRGRKPDAEALRAAMAPLAPAFNLLGDGSRFLQDFDALQGSETPPDMLFIDSAGASTAKKNADLMVRRQGCPDSPDKDYPIPRTTTSRTLPSPGLSTAPARPADTIVPARTEPRHGHDLSCRPDGRSISCYRAGPGDRRPASYSLRAYPDRHQGNYRPGHHRPGGRKAGFPHSA